MTTLNQDQKKDFILIISSVLFLVLISFFLFKFSPQVSRLLKPTPLIIGKAVLTIDFGNDKKRAFGGDIVEHENLLDVLTQASKAGVFSYTLNKNREVASIEDISLEGSNVLKNNGKSWKWYVNNEKVNKPLKEITPKNGDNILIKYE